MKGRLLTSRRALALGLIPLISVVAGARQTPSRCLSNCTIELQRIDRLYSKENADALPTDAIYLTRHNVSSYLLPSGDAKRVILLNRSGSILRLLTGAPKQPFRMITNVLLAPDGTVRVFDTLSGPLFRLNKDLQVVEAIPFRYRPDFMLDGEHYLHVGQIRTPELVGQPLHVLNSEGRVVRSFGTDDPSYRADEPFKYDRIAAPGSRGSVWSVAPGKYLLEQWSPSSGQRVASISVKSTWFKESVRPETGQVRPNPEITALWENGGLIWVLIQDADRQWSPDIRPMPHSKFDPDLYDRMYDWVLEAVSPQSGVVIASRRFDGALWGKSPDFLLATRGRGGPQLEVWQPRLLTKGK